MSTEKIVQSGISQVMEGSRIVALVTVEENLRIWARAKRKKGSMRNDFDMIYGYFPRLRTMWNAIVIIHFDERVRTFKIGFQFLFMDNILLMDLAIGPLRENISKKLQNKVVRRPSLMREFEIICIAFVFSKDYGRLQ